MACRGRSSSGTRPAPRRPDAAVAVTVTSYGLPAEAFAATVPCTSPVVVSMVTPGGSPVAP
ncbi:MAG: hypothetical protein KatS3mg010_0444 [Acidimicrobiia bacterium]|nr:MAG: hypothetical protein KatS3mg010_0444 [Acidimicrobiia bacterium]